MSKYKVLLHFLDRSASWRFSASNFKHKELFKNDKFDFQVKALKTGLIQVAVTLDARQERQDERQERQDDFYII